MTRFRSREISPDASALRLVSDAPDRIAAPATDAVDAADRRYGRFAGLTYTALTDDQAPASTVTAVHLLASYGRARAWMAGDDDRWGRNDLLLTGDYLYGKAFETFGNADLPADRLLAGYRALSASCLDDCGRRFLAEDEPRLAVTVAEVAGALADATPETRSHLRDLGRAVDDAIRRDGTAALDRGHAAIDALPASDARDRLETFVADLGR